MSRDTVQSRIDIGFPKTQSEWAQSAATYDDHTLRIAGHPVMEDWEAPYMTRLAEVAAGRGGRVLEVGYGMGISTTFIQQLEPQEHVVIECHPDVIERCVQEHRGAIAESRLHVITGFWQAVVPLLSDASFDGILFDTYPLSEAEVHRNHFDFFETAYRLLRPGGTFTYYSDEATDYSAEHREQLLSAGFMEHSIAHQICPVTPPDDCEYWGQASFMVPIITR